MRISHFPFPLGGTTLDFKNEVNVFDISRQEWHAGPTVETVNSNDAIFTKHSASYVEENGNILVVGGGKLRNSRIGWEFSFRNFFFCFVGILCFSFGSFFSPPHVLQIKNVNINKHLQMENSQLVKGVKRRFDFSQDSNNNNPKIENVTVETEGIASQVTHNTKVSKLSYTIPRIPCPESYGQFLNLTKDRRPIIFTNVNLGNCSKTDFWFCYNSFMTPLSFFFFKLNAKKLQNFGLLNILNKNVEQKMLQVTIFDVVDDNWWSWKWCLKSNCYNSFLDLCFVTLQHKRFSQFELLQFFSCFVFLNTFYNTLIQLKYKHFSQFELLQYYFL